MTREEKLSAFGKLTKVQGIKTGREFAKSQATARLLIDHPHGYRDWRIVGPAAVPGFFILVSTFRLDPYTQSNERTTFTLVLPDTEFERVH
jgi:hypothetical protein